MKGAVLNETTAKAGPSPKLRVSSPALPQIGFFRVSRLTSLLLSQSMILALSAIGGGTVSEPTETALRAALRDGGAVTFACDGTIVLSSTITNTNDTLLDASGRNVTISGGDLVRIFQVDTNVHLELRNLGLTRGSAKFGAAILNRGGQITLSNIRLDCNVAGRELQFTNLELAEGGAVLNQAGVFAATNCTFFSNVVAQATDPYVRWVQSRGGAICNSAGTVVLESCTFVQNMALGPPRNFRPRDGCGGAVHNGGTLTVLSCDFSENLAGGGSEGGSGYGGAICNYGVLTISGSFFSRNTAFGTEGREGGPGTPLGGDIGGPGAPGQNGGAANGGAIFSGGKALLADTYFAQNSASGGAGGAGGPGCDIVFIPPDHIGFGGDGGRGGNGGAAYGAICDITAFCTLSNCVLEANNGIPGIGGAGGRGGYSNRNGADGAAGTNGVAAGGIRTPGAVVVDTELRSNTPSACLGTLTDAGGNTTSDPGCGTFRNDHQPERNAADYRIVYNFGIPEFAINGEPFGPILVGADGMLYGSTYGAQHDGYPYEGSVFAVSTNGAMGSYRSLVEPPLRPYSTSLIIGQRLFGTCGRGGSLDMGILFSINLDGSGLVTLKEFGDNSGSYPHAGLAAAGNVIYGETARTSGDNGTLFSVRADGSNFVTLKRFDSSLEGQDLTDNLLISQNTLYGTTYSGGLGGEGVVFRMTTDGTGYAVLKHFYPTTDGRHPTLWVISGSVLYGSTYYTQDYDGWRGTIFRINTDGTGFETLYRFPEKAERQQLVGGLVLLNNQILVGTTSGGGNYDRGRLFKLGTDGNGYEVLRHFSGFDGAEPGQLTVYGNAISGVTREGGFFGEGVVFQMNVSSPEITVSPLAQTAEVGGAVELSGAISGPGVRPLQWLVNSETIPGATNPVLRIPNVSINNSGIYSLVAVNPFGAATNTGVLNVISAVERSAVPAIKINAMPGSGADLERTDDVAASDWQVLAPLEVTNGSTWFIDAAMSERPRAFYRVHQPGATSPPQMAMVTIPALKLYGLPGTTVRVEALDAIGPTNDWKALSSVYLTNSPQLFFDASAFEEPRRVYRVLDGP